MKTTEKNLDDYVSVRLTKAQLIGTRHYDEGVKLTVHKNKATELVKGKAAVQLREMDPDAVEPPPAKRQFLPTTASVNPSPSKAARVAGKAE